MPANTPKAFVPPDLKVPPDIANASDELLQLELAASMLSNALLRDHSFAVAAEVVRRHAVRKGYTADFRLDDRLVIRGIADTMISALRQGDTNVADVAAATPDSPGANANAVSRLKAAA